MKRRATWTFLLVSIAFVLSNLAPAVAQVTRAPDPRFGLVESFWLPEEATELGVGWERILFYWRELQPSGPEDWNTLHVREEWLAQANASGRTVVGLLKNTAPWASVDGTEAGLPQGLDLPLSDPGNLWAGFVRKTATYYSVRNVHHWIIWNEPDIKPGTYGFEFAGTVEDYYRLLKVAYLVIKEVDPQATVHLAGLTWWHEPGYLARLLAMAAADPEGPAHDYFFDVISLHIYFRTETLPLIMDEVAQVQRRFGLNKPVWINETNAPPSDDPLWPVNRPQFPVDAQQQAWFVIQAFALGFASGAERVAVYKLVDIHLPDGGESFGLVRPDLSRRPAFFAYQTATRFLGRFDQVDLQSTSDFHVVAFQRPRGTTRVLWARNAKTVTVRAPALSDRATLVNSVGRRQQIAASDGVFEITLDSARCLDECLIGGPPVLLVEEPGADAIRALPSLAYEVVTPANGRIDVTASRPAMQPAQPLLDDGPETALESQSEMDRSVSPTELRATTAAYERSVAEPTPAATMSLSGGGSRAASSQETMSETTKATEASEMVGDIGLNATTPATASQPRVREPQGGERMTEALIPFALATLIVVLAIVGYRALWRRDAEAED